MTVGIVLVLLFPVINFVYSPSAPSATTPDHSDEFAGMDNIIPTSPEQESGQTNTYSKQSGPTRTRAIPIKFGPSVIELERDINTSGLTFQLQKNSTVLEASVSIHGLPSYNYRDWASERVITDHRFDGDSKSPAIALDSTGTLNVVWMDSGPIATQDTDWDIFHAKNHGTTWEPFDVVSTNKIEDSTCPDVFIDSLGDIHIVWVDRADIDNNDKDQDIFYRRIFNETGGLSATKVISKELGIGQSLDPRVVVNSSGDLFIVWQDNGTYRGNSTQYSSIYCRIWHQQNQTWSSIFNLSDFAHNGNATNPELAVDGNSVYAVWTEDGDFAGSGPDQDIIFRQWIGSKWGQYLVISNTTSSGDADNASIYAHNGIICIAWDDNGDIDNSGPDRDIILKVNRESKWLTQTVVSNHTKDNTSTNPKVIIDDDGNYHVVWVEDGNISADNAHTDIIYRYFDSSKNQWDEYIVISDCPFDQESVEPQLMASATGRLEVVWTDYGDIALSGTDPDLIYRSTQPHFPTNLKFRIGAFDKDNFDYHYPGELMDEIFINQSWFRDKLNDLIDTMDRSSQTFYLVLNSETMGRIEIKDLQLLITSTPLPPAELQVIDEDQTHVVSHKPVLGWNFQDNDTKEQGGFKIEVGITPNSSDMWSYGPVNTKNEFVEYAGNTLLDKHDYYFRVKVLDTDGAWSKWSGYQHFRMNAKPVITYLSPYAGLADEFIDIEWHGTDPDGDPLNYTLQAYYNGTWRTVLDNQPDTRFRLDTKSLYSFQQVDLRIKCWDGFEDSAGWYNEEGVITIIHNNPPSAMIEAPAKEGDIANEYYRIKWNSMDPDPNDELVVDLYYDDNTDFTVKETIIQNYPDEGIYIWNTADILQGKYYICIMISDGKSSNYTYSDGQLTIDHTVDTNPPRVEDTIPKPDEHDVKLDQELRVTFNKPIDKSTLTPANFVVWDSLKNIVKGDILYDDSKYEMIFIPKSPHLKYSQVYTVTVKAGIRDESGKYLDGNRDYFSSNSVEDDYTWSFSTVPESVDITPPYILSV
ncbi:Ig-like domain-containing protein, partial [[Eubacterium] cellulosolvens]